MHKKRTVSLLLFILLTSLGLLSCNGSSNTSGLPAGLFAALLTPNGQIRTVASDDGDSFETGDSDVTHTDRSKFGPGIARDPVSGIIALAFFTDELVEGGTKLVIKTGLGPTIWEEDPPASDSLATTAVSAPAIAYLTDGVYAIAWNNGQAMDTASYNQRGLVDTGIVSGFGGSDVKGAPTIASNGDTALMIWQSNNKPGVYHSAIGRHGRGDMIAWQPGSDISLNIENLAWNNPLYLGTPGIAWDGSSYWLAAFGTEDYGNASGRVIALLNSGNGQEDWRVDSTCLLAAANEPFGNLALSVSGEKIRLLIHRDGRPEVAYIEYVDGVCNEIARFDSDKSAQPAMIWSAIPVPVEEPTANALWIEQGPGPIFSGQVEGIPNRPVVGAVQSIAPHPSNPDIMYIGAVAGGVWMTENALAESPNWIPLTDKMPSLSIGSVIFDPCDAQGNSLFVATGDFSSTNRASPSKAVGIYYSSDGGDTWQIIGDTDGDGDTNIGAIGDFSGRAIRNLVAGPCNLGTTPLFAGTSRGIFIGRQATPTSPWVFAPIPVANPAPVRTGNVTSLIADTQDPNTLFAGVLDSPVQVFRSSNAGATWSLPTPDGLPGVFTGSAVRLSMSSAPSESGVPALYVAVSVDENAIVMRSTNRGNSWNPMLIPLSGGRGPFPGRQSNSHFSLAAHPSLANIVFLGGDRQPRNFSASGTEDFSGNLFVGDSNMPANHRWQPLVGDNANGTSPHADSRHLIFNSAGHLIEADDGGLYRMRTPTSSNRKWESMNGNLRITEFYSVAWDSQNDLIIGGTQDVGSVEQMAAGGPGHFSPWRDARLYGLERIEGLEANAEGDGGNVAIDNNSQANASTRYTMGNNFRMFFRRTFPEPNPVVDIATWLTFVRPGSSGCSAVAPAPFCGLHVVDQNLDMRGFVRRPFALNNIEPTRLVVGLNATYESSDQGLTWDIALNPNLQCAGRPCPIQALAYGGTASDGPNPGLLIAAFGNALQIRQNFGGQPVNRFIGGGAFSNTARNRIRDFVLDPSDWRTVYVVQQSGQVFRIDDITNLASAPVNITLNITTILTGLQSLEIVQAEGETVLLAGGIPINRSATGTNTGGVAHLRFAKRVITDGFTVNWQITGMGLPNASASDLHYNEEDDVLLVGTLGRGAWTIENASKVLRPSP